MRADALPVKLAENRRYFNFGDDMDQFYLQDTRSYLGNALVFWAKGCNGYTSDPSKAHVFTRAEAVEQHSRRITDVPWPKEYIDARTCLMVDAQHVRRAEALEAAGVVLRDPPRHEPPPLFCDHCGKGVSRHDVSAFGECPHCGRSLCP